MPLTETRKQWLARYRKAIVELRETHPLNTKMWLRHMAKTVADMGRKRK